MKYLVIKTYLSNGKSYVQEPNTLMSREEAEGVIAMYERQNNDMAEFRLFEVITAVEQIQTKW